MAAVVDLREPGVGVSMQILAYDELLTRSTGVQPIEQLIVPPLTADRETHRPARQLE